MSQHAGQGAARPVISENEPKGPFQPASSGMPACRNATRNAAWLASAPPRPVGLAPLRRTAPRRPAPRVTSQRVPQPILAVGHRGQGHHRRTARHSAAAWITTPPPTLTPSRPSRAASIPGCCRTARPRGQRVVGPLARRADRALVRIRVTAGEAEAERGQAGLHQKLRQADKPVQVVVVTAEAVAEHDAGHGEVGGLRQSQRSLEHSAVGVKESRRGSWQHLAGAIGRAVRFQ